MKLTKKFVRENTTISKVTTTNGSTLRGCQFRVGFTIDCEELETRFYANLEKWGWIEDRGAFVITWEGMRNIPMI